MSNAKYTPGPWEVDETVVIVGWPVEIPVNVVIICRVDQDGNMTQEEAEANTRLIAAAPELLQALEELEAVAHFDAMGMPFDEGECPVCDRARDVIAKAKGK